MNLSVILIAKNEEASIARALRSVAWADEIVVVDSGSADRTVDIAREFGAKVVVTGDWPGFGPQKNRALDLATGDWVLSLDADEWLTVASAEEIRRAIGAGATGAAAFRMPRRSSFCGRFMRHSGWWPDYVVRLFRRGSARFSDDSVHERVMVEGAIGTLREPIMHETYVDLEDMLVKMNSYSTLTARSRQQDGKTSGLVQAVSRAVWAFIRTYFLRAGFLDGREGFMLAVATAEGTYYRYLKLLLLRDK
jgi:glycosyltransferase involved in cell wall biosynthesis